MLCQCYLLTPYSLSDGRIILISSLVSGIIRLALCTKNTAAVKHSRNHSLCLALCFLWFFVASLFISDWMYIIIAIKKNRYFWPGVNVVVYLYNCLQSVPGCHAQVLLIRNNCSDVDGWEDLLKWFDWYVFILKAIASMKAAVCSFCYKMHQSRLLLHSFLLSIHNIIC